MNPRLSARAMRALHQRSDVAAASALLVLTALVFFVNVVINLPHSGRSGIGPTQLAYLASSVLCLSLAVWIWLRGSSTSLLLSAAIPGALVLMVANVLWTEYRWPDFGVGPFGYMLILNCTAGVLLRDGRVLAAFLAGSNLAWLTIDRLTTGTADLGNAKPGLILISMLIGVAVFLALRFDRNRQAELNEALARQRNEDSLTGVLNRRGLCDSLTGKNRPDHHPVWCAYVDIDHFKAINDEFGHDYGDRTLTAVASTLVGLSGPDWRVARWGGDEFVVLGLETAPAETGLENELNRCLGELEEPCRATVGLARVAESDGRDGGAAGGDAGGVTNSLIRRADRRMYHRRRQRRERIRVTNSPR